MSEKLWPKNQTLQEDKDLLIKDVSGVCGHWSGESKWQPLDGSRRMVRKSAKTDGQKRSSEIPPVLLGIPWPALRGPLRNQFWKKRRPQPYWGGENSGNALEASNALSYRVWGIPAVLSREISGNALRAFPGSFRNFSGISSGKSQPYWGCGLGQKQTTQKVRKRVKKEQKRS